jgi:hypothetical protein
MAFIPIAKEWMICTHQAEAFQVFNQVLRIGDWLKRKDVNNDAFNIDIEWLGGKVIKLMFENKQDSKKKNNYHLTLTYLIL